MLVENYIKNFTLGVDAYPDVLCKASVIRSCLEGLDLELLKEKVPPTIVDFLDTLPPNSVWVSEVKSQIVFLGMVELLESDGFLAHVSESNRRLFSSPLYRSLFGVFSARRSVKLVAGAWGRFHRGSQMTVIAAAQNKMTLRIDAPKNLFDSTLMHAFSQSCAVALDVGGAKNPRVTPGEMNETTYRFELSWN